jgi:NAD(P)-dependent dehydrogenase (short-subunit alcohol dehydrogenase family)
MSTVSLVTGANRGIGREVATQLAGLGHRVLVGSRDPARGEPVVGEIASGGGQAAVVALDIASPDSAAAAAATIDQQYGRLDVLVNNAAVIYDTHQKAIDADLSEIREALDTNLFGTWQTMQAFVPLLRRSSHGRIVNVSSGVGALADMGGRLPAYRISKVGLSALTRMWAAELPGVLVNAVCPGWVATDMGGPGGRPVAEGAAGVVWAATLSDDGPTGGFFRDGEPIDW